jgi:acetyl-CoA carboxylase carboxyl transferase subunit beta
VPEVPLSVRISAASASASCRSGSFEERETSLATADPLGFKDTKKYRERVRAAAQKTASDEAVICGVASIGGQPAVLAVFEFGFLAAAWARWSGEKLTRAIELAIDKHLPVVIVSASGGAGCRRASCR